MKHEIVIKDLSGIDAAAKRFLAETEGRTLIAFYAPMGAGKTTFTTAICRELREAEALDIGLYDYLDSGALCLMEWPENVEGLLPEETLKVHISVAPDGARTIFWEDNG